MYLASFKLESSIFKLLSSTSSLNFSFSSFYQTFSSLYQAFSSLYQAFLACTKYFPSCTKHSQACTNFFKPERSNLQAFLKNQSRSYQSSKVRLYQLQVRTKHTFKLSIIITNWAERKKPSRYNWVSATTVVSRSFSQR